MNPPAEFLAKRLELWDKLKKEYDEFIASQPNTPIKITLPDGKQVDGECWKTTPYDVARGIRYETTFVFSQCIFSLLFCFGKLGNNCLHSSITSAYVMFSFENVLHM